MSLEHPAWGRMHPDDAELASALRRLPPIGERKAFSAAMVRLGREAARRGRGAAVFHELEMSPSAGHRVALEFLIRLPDPLPLVLTAAAVPVLKVETIPLPLRLAAAGKLLDSVPDDPQTVYPVLQALTHGTTRIKRHERLLQLHRMVRRCATLDVIVEDSELKAKLDCPRCEKRLPRGKLIIHLWHKHGLMFRDRQAVPPRALLDALITSAATERTTDRIDEAFHASNSYEPAASNRLVFQALCSRGEPEPGEVEQLLASARAERAGLCPVCLQSVPWPLPQLAPPANLACGRLSAEGFEARVVDSTHRRRVFLERYAEEREDLPNESRIAPRASAATVAATLLILVAAAVLFVPSRLASPWLVAAVGMVVALSAFLIRRFTPSTWPNADETALAVAWAELTPGLGRSDRAVRFLTRLCRLSLTLGDPAARAPQVYDLVEKARTLANRNPASMQLAAVVELLLVFDRVRMNRAKLHDAALLFRDVFDGTRDWTFGETLAELILEDASLRNGDDRRLGVMILGLAFEAGWSPRDVGHAARYLPHFARLCRGNDPLYLDRLCEAGFERDRATWDRLGGAVPMTIFAEKKPDEARRILAVHPDALLKINDPEAIGDELGPLVLTTLGPAVGRVIISDAAMPMSCLPIENRLFRITFGGNRIPSRRAVPDSFFAALRGWAKYAGTSTKRTTESASSPHASAAVQKLAVDCPLCGFAAIPVPGRLGTPIQGVLGG